MLHQHELPHSLWKEAIAYATYLKNRLLTHAIQDHKVPDEVFWGKRPDISCLREFGKKCWVLQQDGKNSKLDPKSHQFIFVGIAVGTKGYRYYNPQTHQILTSCNVVFMEQPDGFDDVEVTHPAPLEGESGNSGKQTLGDSGNGVASNSDHSPEKETHHTSITPSKIPVPRERSSRILAQPLVNYWLLNNLNF